MHKANNLILNTFANVVLQDLIPRTRIVGDVLTGPIPEEVQGRYKVHLCYVIIYC